MGVLFNRNFARVRPPQLRVKEERPIPGEVPLFGLSPEGVLAPFLNERGW